MHTTKTHYLTRRGFDLGNVTVKKENVANTNAINYWQSGEPILLKSHCLSALNHYQQELKQSNLLYHAILDNEQCNLLVDVLLNKEPYIRRLTPQFTSLGSSINEGDDQEIETILFDAVHQEKIVAEDLWMKISWLSFYEQDASLRCRFSFGVDLHEDVAADIQRQHYSSVLNDVIFPESKIITNDQTLVAQLTNFLNCHAIHFVERIVYFNAPQGGAYLHHDRERGHAGVVFAQLSGSTFWLALTRSQLVKEIIHCIDTCQSTLRWPETVNTSMQGELLQLSKAPELLINELESFNNSALIHLINETEIFVQQLIRHGHGKTLFAGDMLLLPQETPDNCCWHSVFTLGETTGEALSFAIRKA